jgi:hypothetical protein
MYFSVLWDERRIMPESYGIWGFEKALVAL